MTRLLLMLSLGLGMAGCSVVWHPLDRDYYNSTCKLEKYAGEKNDVLIPCRVQERTQP